MKLKIESIEWAMNHLINYGDTDIFPKPYEIDVLNEILPDLVKTISETDLDKLKNGVSRKFIVPKDDLSYRIATQLDPLDSIILSSIIYEYGSLIENNRIAENENYVFSYRFKPDTNGNYYPNTNSWTEFWTYINKESNDYDYALTLDISDFYNQIYHHSIENSLIQYGFPNQVKKWILNLLKSTTSKVSRGIPIGPHSVHILAESVLASIDNSLRSRGIKFARYVDDYVLFCKTEVDARKYVLNFADILDKQQRLIVQKQKTKIYTKKEIQALCAVNIDDRPINTKERKMLKIIKKYAGDNPYSSVLIKDISPEDLAKFSEKTLENIFKDYLKEAEPNYIRLRWFIRRLSQVGHPAGLNYLLTNISSLLPVLNDIIRYIVSIDNASLPDWPKIGENLLSFLDNELIKENSYYLLAIYSIFNTKPMLNHIHVFFTKYNTLSEDLKREIIFIAYVNNCFDWLRELKENYSKLDIWSKRAYLIAASKLPVEERKFFLNSHNSSDILNNLIIKWAKNK